MSAKLHPPPHLIWFHFKEAQQPVMISFHPRRIKLDSWKYAKDRTPTQLQVIGSADCLSWSEITDVIHIEPPTSVDDQRIIPIEKSHDNPEAFSCIGLRILKNAGSQESIISSLQMWVLDRSTDIREVNEKC